MGLISAPLQILKIDSEVLGLGSFTINPRPLYPNDPLFAEQKSLIRSNFPEAWSVSHGKSVRVAVIDSGVTLNHPDLSEKIADQRDFLDDDPIAEDELGHGTRVAGTIAATTNNNEGIAGRCLNCNLIIAKALDTSGGSRSDVAEAIRWSADRGAKVINVSFAGADTEALKSAIGYAHSKDAVIVAAVHNTSTGRLNYPAAYDGVLAVAAANTSDPEDAPEYGGWVDVSAPGKDILAPVPGGRYREYSGTSYAAPQVAALAALLVAEGYAPEDVRQKIKQSAVDIGPKGNDPYFGEGRIDAAEAVR